MSFNIKRLAVVSFSYFMLILVFLYFYLHGIPRPSTVKQQSSDRKAKNTVSRPRTVKNKKQGNLPARRWDDEKQQMVRTTRVLGKKIETHLSSPYFNPFYMKVENPFPKNLPCGKAPWNIDWYTVRHPDTYVLLTPKSCHTTVNFKDVYHLDDVSLDDEGYLDSQNIPLRVLKLDLASTVDSQPPVWLEVQRWWIRELKMKVLGFYIPDMLATAENGVKDASEPGSLSQEETSDTSEDGFLFVRSNVGEEEQARYMRWHFWIAPAEDERKAGGNRERAWFYAEPDKDKVFEYMERFKSVYGYYPAYSRF